MKILGQGRMRNSKALNPVHMARRIVIDYKRHTTVDFKEIYAAYALERVCTQGGKNRQEISAVLRWNPLVLQA